MQILVVSATGLEIAPFMVHHPADNILISGVGVPATIYHLQKRLQQVDYDLVIQAGICGNFNPHLEMGSPVLVYRDVFADLGIEEESVFYTIGEKGLVDTEAFPYKQGWLVNENPLLQKIDLPKVNGITLNRIGDNPGPQDQYYKKFVPDVESMEGAALHYVCLQEQVPFLQLRTISNKVGVRDKTLWQLDLAIENLNKSLELILEHLKTESIE